MITRWKQAATILPPSIKVCGKKLLPFCLRHRVALETIESPVLNTNNLVGATDIINAVRILSTHNLEDIRRPFSFWETYYFKRMQISKKLLQQEANKLLMYFAEQSLWPRFWEVDNKKNKSSNIDWPLLVIANLVKNGCTLKEAWIMPESEAVWLHIAYMDIQGIDPKVVSDMEWNAMQDELKRTSNIKTEPK